MLKILTLLVVSLLTVPAAEGVAGTRCESWREHRQQFVERFDSDGDGRLSDSERAAARAACSAKLKERHPQLFARIDTDGDGVISRAEGKAARERCHQRRHNAN